MTPPVFPLTLDENNGNGVMPIQPERPNNALSSLSSTTVKSSRMSIPSLSKDEAEDAIARFGAFLRFATVSRIAPETGAYRACAEWLLHELRQIPVLFAAAGGGGENEEEEETVFFLKEAPEDSPVVVAVWKGSRADLPVILLNSHYDVVPVSSEWTKPCWGGRENGKIYGRGTQDMKSVGMQYIEAIRYLSKTNFQPIRSIYLTFVPDEEIGGAGMAAFLDSSVYRSLPGIALALDEGLASLDETLAVFYGERIPWFVEVTATGPTGHGSRFIDNTAVEQLLELCQKALAFRKGQRDLLGLKHDQNCTHAVQAKQRAKARKNQTNGSSGGGSSSSNNISSVKDLGEVTSLNITALQAGVESGGVFAYNCVPPSASCALDIRISPHTNPLDIDAMLNQWCRECSKDPSSGAGISWKYLGNGHDGTVHHLTSTDPTVNPWYGVFGRSLQELGLSWEPQVFPAASDSRFLRALGIRALGFSPMRSTKDAPVEILLHEVDEYIPEATFLEGIGIYVHLIRCLASQECDIDK